MNNLHISDSYKVWRISEMNELMTPRNCCLKDVETILNRPLWTIYIEWWLHNIGYYLTKPIAKLQHINLRCKNVDLNEWQSPRKNLF